MYLTVAMVALIAFVSLAVDLGRVQLVRGELQLAADAGARHGAAGLGAGVAAAQANAVNAAKDNKADGTPVVLNTSTDIEFGTFNDSTQTFAALPAGSQSGADAIRVIARRTAASGNAVPLFFARVVGRTICDVKAQSVARYSAGTSTSGIVGLNGITTKNNAFIGSYSSSTTTNPTPATATSSGNLTSNGAISGGSGSDLKGNVTLGPSAPALSGITVSGKTTRASTAIPAPAPATWSPAANPNGVSQNYTVGSNTTLPGGTYWFTSLSVQGSLTFSGPATLVINGNVDVQGTLYAYNNIPANLKIKVIGNNRVFGNAGSDDVDIIADIEAPGADLVSKNKFKFRGRMIFDTIDVKNNAEIYYDTALGSSGGGGAKVVTVR
jgi:hypothetical protein